MPTNFPRRGDDQKIALQNSGFPQFDRGFAERLKDSDPEIWRAGGNIRGNAAFRLWGRARSGDESASVLSWIKEREAWAARHLKDGSQFPGASPTISSVAGVVAAIKWGVILGIGESAMKKAIRDLQKKRAERMQHETSEHRHLIGIAESEEGYVLTFAKEIPPTGPQPSTSQPGSDVGDPAPVSDPAPSAPRPTSPDPVTQDPPKVYAPEDEEERESEPSQNETSETMSEIERRYLTPETQSIEIRQVGDERRVEGYAAVFNSPTTIQSRRGSFREMIDRTAFEGRLEDPVVALFNHDQLRPLAKVGAGLDLAVDDYGLRYSFPVPDTTTGRDLVELMDRGIVREASFAFTIAPDGERWERPEGEDMDVRTITRVGRLIDVSVVTLGAYSDASAALRSFEGSQSDEQDLDHTETPEHKRNDENGRENAPNRERNRERVRALRLFSILNPSIK